MPYLASYMRKYSYESDLSNADLIIVVTSWGLVQGLILPIGGTLVTSIGVKGYRLGPLTRPRST